MKKWIRWQGFAAFLTIFGLLAILWVFLVDGFVRKMIQNYGSSAVGAQVDLASADLSLFPMGLRLEGLQVTNPDNPTTNALEIAKASMAIDTGNLLRRKIIIDDMSLDGIRFNTKRAKPGKIFAPASKEKKEKAKKTESKKGAIESFDFPDAKDIMQRESLQTITLAKEIQADIKSAKENWKQQLQDLPDQKKLDEHEARIKKIKSSARGGLGGLFSAASDVKNIQKDIERDLDSLENAQDLLSKKTKEYEKKLKTAANAPADDFVRLKEKYSFSSKNIGNISGLLFGAKAGEYTDKIIFWYQKIKPYLEKAKDKSKTKSEAVKKRGQGENIKFKEHEPLPDFLIRMITASLSLEAGDLSGEILNITPDQNIIAKPTTFLFSGANLNDLESVKISGVLDHIHSKQSHDSMEISFKKMAFKGKRLSDSKDFTLSLDNASVDMDIQATLKNGSLFAHADSVFNSVRFNQKEKGNSFSEAIGSALSEINHFNIKADAQGTIEDYDIKLSSDLDSQLKKAFEQSMQKKAKEFEKQLKDEISAKAKGPLDDLKSEYNGFELIEKELSSRLDSGAQLTDLLKLF